MRRHLIRAAAAAALLIAARASAVEPTLGGPRDQWPSEITRRPLTLGAGMVEVWAPVQLNASKDADWKPVTSNPSIAFGVTDQWMIGFRHVVGLCIGNEADGCVRGKHYDDVGAFTRISVLRGAGLDAAVQGAVHVSPLSGSDHNWSADASVLLRAGGGAVAVTVQPTVGFGLNDRDTRLSRLTPIAWNFGTYDVITPGSTVGNREHASLPVTLQLQLGPALALAVGASLEGPLNPVVGSFEDYYTIPAGAGVVFTPLRYLDVGATFTFPNFGGKQDTRDVRQLALFVAFRI
ncbi:MAG TPA: hypothetical protein VFL83_00490 [Anaeromyxobacter sp.]|nr:hypothetical protein [Anaeromyxobacter sp.]